METNLFILGTIKTVLKMKDHSMGFSGGSAAHRSFFFKLFCELCVTYQ